MIRRACEGLRRVALAPSPELKRRAEQVLTSDIAFITPSYRGDFARSTLLFESMDKYVRSFSKHYVIVHDEDLGLFAPYQTEKRVIMPASRFLPTWLHHMPSFIRWRGRRYMWSFRALPIYGWHTQQLVKIAAAASLPEARYCLIDSDSAFFRPFDIAAFARPKPAPLLTERQAIVADKPRHSRWTKGAAEMLGLPMPVFPADDYIGTMVVWDQRAVQAMIRRIEEVTGRPWAEALCRANSFSECMLYGMFVANEAGHAAEHAPISERYCRVYWDKATPDQATLLALLHSCSPRQVAVCVQSFNETPLAVIREAIAAFNGDKPTAVEAARAPALS